MAAPLKLDEELLRETRDTCTFTPAAKMLPAVTSHSHNSIPMAIPTKALVTHPTHIKESNIGVSLCDRSSPQINGQSMDSGHADVTSEIFGCSSVSSLVNLYKGVKFLSIVIPTTSTGAGRKGSSKYTLYDIKYQAVYSSEDGDKFEIKDRTVYRRYREFINLRGRLEKSSLYAKALKSISTPSWWHQLSLAARKPQEVEKRRAKLETFLQQLIAQPVLSSSKDVEEFLAYNGGAEIEFVQENIEFIPPAVRLDKVMIRMFDRVTDKLTTQSSAADSTDPSAIGRKKSKQEDAALRYCLGWTITHQSEFLLSDFLSVQEKLNHNQPLSFSTSPDTEIKISDAYHDQSQKLADALFQLALLLFQRHSDSSKNSKIVSAVGSILLPYISQWSRNKVLSYSTAPELTRLLHLFTDTLWPEVKEQAKSYDIEYLEAIARQCVINALPAPVVLLLKHHVNQIITDVFEMMNDEELNKQLVYVLVGQLLKNSLSFVVD
ncbi:SNX19 [Bugula neritina]|uniref:SNX19 n=2 Tax=Bugula neritina TaxID=10212 RepID=A0A7J7JA38_BUGNE|nr:SNX19 [Bugula neritina]